MNRLRPRSVGIYRSIEALLLLASLVFFAFHAMHLSADFPNHSPWMDWAKYTDEGWYGDAAIRHFQRGHWYVPGDFNPAAALPVWPLLEGAVFKFTGVELTAARALTVAIFGGILVASWLLLRRGQDLADRAQHLPEHRGSIVLVPAIAVLMLSVSPFCYAFTRMAILEPLLILLELLALLAACYVNPVEVPEEATANPVRQILPVIALGLLIPMMVLTKTTAVFLVPSILWILWVRSGYRPQPFLRLAVPVAALAAVTWCGYFFLVVHPHFLKDYRYLFSANAYTGITAGNAVKVLSDTVRDGMWIGPIVYPLALLAVVTALVTPRLMRNPLIVSLLLWAGGYAAFLAYHDNLQPRYYLVIAIPLTLLVPVVFANVWRSPARATRYIPPVRRFAAGAAIAVLAVMTARDARQMLHYVRTPEYTFTTAAAEIDRIISSDPSHSPLILSISGSNLSLMTGLPSICDDFGTMELADRVRAYKPGWYIAWNQVDDDKMDALSPLYHLKRIAAFPAMDDPERNLLILYRLDPATPGTPRRHRKPPVPHMLQTSFGQQPAAVQLMH